MDCEFELQKLDGNIALFTILKCMCSIDSNACNHIKDATADLEKDGYAKYIFDLQHLDLVNSRFIGLMAKLHYELNKKGGKVVILKPQDMVNISFEMSGLFEVLNFFSDQTEAINSFKD